MGSGLEPKWNKGASEDQRSQSCDLFFSSSENTTLVLVYDTFFLVDRTWVFCIIYTECIFFQKIFSRKSRALGI